MKAHHLSIMSLEEYEPNPEFVGRNFNAGEVIQLVLRAPRTGHWLGFRSVQMVMMHELAHCKQMNHSGAFWAVRNQFADELRKLWEQNYTGDGFWGRGKTLLSGQYEPVSGLRTEEIVPRSLCGGTFRSSRGRKRKRKGDGSAGADKSLLSYAERQQRRIAKKFGTNGVKLGDDSETRVKLEDGKKAKGKPRVAGSARGRELRAAAALARFGSQKEGSGKKEEPGPDEVVDSETDSEEHEDLNDSRLSLDPQSKGMIKVCEDEDQSDIHVKQEMQELQDLNEIDLHSINTATTTTKTKTTAAIAPKQEPPPVKIEKNTPRKNAIVHTTHTQSNPLPSSPIQAVIPPIIPKCHCPICSLANDPSATICIACAHVLDRDVHPGHWRCTSPACRESEYINSRDYALCGVCGARRVGDDDDGIR